MIFVFFLFVFLKTFIKSGGKVSLSSSQAYRDFADCCIISQCPSLLSRSRYINDKLYADHDDKSYPESDFNILSHEAQLFTYFTHKESRQLLNMKTTV